MTDLPGFPTRADAVANELRRAILGGELPPGTRLRQAEVAERFGVSTTPVREAFVALLRQGFLDGDAHRGVMVRRPDLQEMQELYEIRTALEPLAAGKAAERITPDEVAELERILNEMQEVAANPSASAKDRHDQLNTEFHRRIYDIAARPRLFELVMNLRTQSDIYVRMFPIEVLATGAGDDQHAAILDALRAKAPKRAERAMREHLVFTAQHITDQIAHHSAVGASPMTS